MQVLYIPWALINVIAVFSLIERYDTAKDLCVMNPKVVYENIKVNWFGAWVLAIIFNVLFPMIAIPYWIYKLCTVGRGNE